MRHAAAIASGCNFVLQEADLIASGGKHAVFLHAQAALVQRLRFLDQLSAAIHFLLFMRSIAAAVQIAADQERRHCFHAR